MGELLDLYTKDREKTGQTFERGTQQPQGLYRLWTWVVFRNRTGKILMTRRHPNKSYGGLWEETAGCVLAGETPGEAAVREVKEELGLEIDLLEGKLVASLCFEEDRSLADLWLFEREIDLKALKLQAEEVTEARWVSRAKFEQMVEKGMVHPQTQRVFELIDGGLLSYCGLDCRECPVYQATSQGDEKRLEELAAAYSTPQCRLNRHNLKCMGCFSTLAGKNKMCAGCAIRKCALDREKKGKAVANCGRCPDFPCAVVEQLAPVGMKSRNTLNLIASGLE